MFWVVGYHKITGQSPIPFIHPLSVRIWDIRAGGKCRAVLEVDLMVHNGSRNFGVIVNCYEWTAILRRFFRYTFCLMISPSVSFQGHTGAVFGLAVAS